MMNGKKYFDKRNPKGAAREQGLFTHCSWQAQTCWMSRRCRMLASNTAVNCWVLAKQMQQHLTAEVPQMASACRRGC
jgi:hypothetical protein